jgi:choline dehydrogenase-like flavoprotein
MALSRKDSTDVVVIGCGAGGGVVAKELGEAGLSVVVLEAGKRFNPADYPTHQADFEIAGARIFRAEDPGRDAYTWDGPARVHYERAKGVGGSTLHYLGVSPRFHESDFRVHSEEGIADDWPISYAELEPYYTKVEYELGVSGLGGPQGNPFDPPRSKPFPTPAHALNCASLAVKRGADKLGLHLVPSPLAIPTVSWQGRPACMGAGVCGLGCRIGAKSSIDVTYVRKAEATGRVQIRTESTAREITLTRDGKAKSVIHFDARGKEQEIFARAVVVAGNAVETPRLLLLSQSRHFPDGLANSSGLVGKYFMEHLAVFMNATFDERLNAWQGSSAGGMLQDFYATDRRNHFARGWMIEVNNGAQWPVAVARRVGGWGAQHKARMKRTFGHGVGLATVGEQLPDLRNQITLDPEVKDHLGLPAPRLTNEPHANDRRMLEKIPLRLREIFQAAGAAEISQAEYRPGWSAHYLGTCRMGRDPRTSVVDPWGRSHDVRNLFIADGSVFVTGAAVNPALTISALATRTAEGMVAAFNRREL